MCIGELRFYRVERAVDVAFAGASCGVQSCVDNGLAELASLLDTTGATKTKPAAKTSVSRKPSATSAVVAW